MRYEIIIEPQNKKYCGNCSYKNVIYKDWYCKLFRVRLGSSQSYVGRENLAAKRLCECVRIAG